MKPVLIMACGNTLRGDDGVAWRIGSALQDELQAKLSESGVELILTKQLLPEHAEPLSGADLAVFLDCSAIAKQGVVSTHSLSPAQSLPGIFTHQLDPPSLLKLAQDLYGRIPLRAVAITIGGKCFELQEQLSRPVAAAIPIAVQAVHRAVFASESQRCAATLVRPTHESAKERN